MKKYEVEYRYIGGVTTVEADNKEEAEYKAFEEILHNPKLDASHLGRLELQTTGVRELQISKDGDKVSTGE